LAVLLARCTLPRPLQTARSYPVASVREPRQAATAADLRPDQLPWRALSWRVRDLRRVSRADAQSDLSSDRGERRRRPTPRLGRALEGLLCALDHHRRRRLAVRAGATKP